MITSISGRAYYFCGLSGKWHLDHCRLSEYERETGNAARVRGVWVSKVDVLCRVILGDNIGTFKTLQDLQAFNKNGPTAILYNSFIETKVTRWIEAD